MARPVALLVVEENLCKRENYSVTLALADTFEYSSYEHGLKAFYQGELARSFAGDLALAGSPLTS